MCEKGGDKSQQCANRGKYEAECANRMPAVPRVCWKEFTKPAANIAATTPRYYKRRTFD